MQGVESQVAVNTENIARLEVEVDRLRDRCHKLESDRATVRHLKTLVENLIEDLPNLARQAAREAVSEMQRRKRADTFANWRTYATLLSAGAAVGALIVSIILRG